MIESTLGSEPDCIKHRTAFGGEARAIIMARFSLRASICSASQAFDEGDDGLAVAADAASALSCCCRRPSA